MCFFLFGEEEIQAKRLQPQEERGGTAASDRRHKIQPITSGQSSLTPIFAMKSGDKLASHGVRKTISSENVVDAVPRRMLSYGRRETSAF